MYTQIETDTLYNVRVTPSPLSIEFLSNSHRFFGIDSQLTRRLLLKFLHVHLRDVYT